MNFNIFPKKKSVDEIIEDANLTPSWEWTPTQTPSMLQAQNELIEQFLKENHDLKLENQKLKKDVEDQKQLKDSLQRVNEKYIKKIIEQSDKIILLENAIERWHSRSKEWEKMDEEIQSTVSELTKEVRDLRHLKTENVELIERLLQKEGNSYGITFNEAKTQIIQNDYKKCAKERDEYKHQLNAANKEIEILKQQKHPMYPIHWVGYDKNIIDFVESEFNNEDPLEGKQVEEAVEELKNMKTQGFEDYDPSDFEQPVKDVEFNPEELLKRVTEYADSLDTLPKSFPDEFQKEKSWEEAASDLALRVVKLEKKVEELTTIKFTSDPNYKYFLEHGKWPYSAMNPDGTLKTIPC